MPAALKISVGLFGSALRLAALSLAALSLAAACAADDAALKDFSDIEVKQFSPEKDLKTGFVTGGKKCDVIDRGAG